MSADVGTERAAALHQTWSEMTGLLLISACRLGDVQTVKSLVSEGANVSRGDYDNRTPLHLASAEGRLDVVKYLVEELKVDVNAKDRWGGTPLSDAIRSKQYHVAQFLKGHGGVARQKAVGDELCKAVNNNDIDQLTLLLDNGADVNTPGVEGRTALHVAAESGSTQITKLLLERGAYANVTDRLGNTPYHLAFNKKQSEVMDLLHSYGASVLDDLEKLRNRHSFVASLQEALILVCEKEKWAMGSAWIMNNDGTKLVGTTAWYAARGLVNRMAEYRIRSENASEENPEQSSVAVGTGLVGTAGQSKEVVFWRDVASDDYARFAISSKEIARELGIKSAMAIPILYKDSVLAVLEFLSTEQKHKNEEILSDCVATAQTTVVNGMLAEKDGPAGQLKAAFSAQANLVYRLVLQKAVYNEQVVLREIDWFYNKLGINSRFFEISSPQLIAQTVIALIAAKMYAETKGINDDNIQYSLEEPNFALYVCAEKHCLETERRIEKLYLGEGYTTGLPEGFDSSRLQRNATAIRFYRSTGTVGPRSTTHIALYLVDLHPYLNPAPPTNERDVRKLTTGAFLRDKSSNTLQLYQKIVEKAKGSLHPIVDVVEDPLQPGSSVMLISYPTNGTHSFFSSLNRLFENSNMQCNSKYLEQFSNGVSCMSFHVPVSVSELEPLMDEVSLMFVLPRTSLFPLLADGRLTPEEVTYAYAGWKFAYYFVSSHPEEFAQLWERHQHDSIERARLLQLKKSIRSEATTESRVAEIVFARYEIIKKLYEDFRERFQPLQGSGANRSPRTEYRTGKNEALEAYINKTVADKLERQVLTEFLTFNYHILKTNFYKKDKSGLAFRLNAEFLAEDYVEVPYAVYYFLGAEYRGFHVRFDDVARGGIRMVRSRDKDMYLRNAEKLFDECYNLSLTQQRKNKDIPEGGSKGVILLSTNHQNKAKFAFRKYIDSLLDLLLVDRSKPAEDIVDNYGNPELIFCGPDEGTADFMDWASLHAKSRGFPSWAGFTTGKSVALGGIPHDLYGMTTNSIHQYVLGVLEKVGLDESTVTKVQTGGPDGDLGSNEIKISHDKTIAIVDGSGVLYDPKGIDRAELLRLATLRKMVEHFDQSKLSSKGFFVHVDDKDVILPDGTVVDNGTTFRNFFHLDPRATADLFVPCGGRPEAVNASNVKHFFVGEDGDRKPKYKYIIEGANLFFTQEARLVLEKAGVIMFKDASTNKGGVTSSSLEVLSALCFTDDEYIKNMCVGEDGVIPEFRRQYVQETKDRIATNARQEFACIWREGQRTSMPNCVLTDELSNKINQLTQEVRGSELWNDENLRRRVLGEALPQCMVEKLGVDVIASRLPEQYTKALLSSHLASKYIYQAGIAANEFSFYQFMSQYTKTPSTS